MKQWLSRWWRARASPRGLSTGVGAIGGLILLVTVLTAGIGAAKAVQAHDVLTQAAHVAAQSEQQNGCWTNATTQAVYHTLKSGGLNPSDVVLTADTPNSTGYGNPVTAGVSTKVGVSVLGASLISVPLQATVNDTSFYTPTAQGGTNSACVTPATCPDITKTVQHCTAPSVCNQSGVTCTPAGNGTYNVSQPVTTQQCSTSQPSDCNTSGYTCSALSSTTWNVCHNVTTQNCSGGYEASFLDCTEWNTNGGYGCVAWSGTTCTAAGPDGCLAWYWAQQWVPYTCSSSTTSQCQTESDQQTCQNVTTTKNYVASQQCTNQQETVNECTGAVVSG